MSDNTKIEWTDATWNVITGCSVVSSGCRSCYAMKLAGTRLQHHPSRAGLTVDTKNGPVWTGEVRFNEQWLTQPISWTKQRMIFVCAHGDLFHESVPDEWIDRVFGVMWACLYGRKEQPGHIFQVLTKRAARMRDYMRQDRREQWARAATDYGGGIDPDGIYDQTAYFEGPHPRIWLGVSVEDQAAADERIPLLLDTPAAVRWISAEPLLGPVDLDRVYLSTDHARWVDWVVVGGESGQNARPMHPAWARSLRDQCAAAGVPFLFKQWGEWGNDGRVPQLVSIHEKSHFLTLDGKRWIGPSQSCPKGTAAMLGIGKKAAGRLLDGVQHDGYPVEGGAA